VPHAQPQTAEQYAGALRSLVPPGRIWPESLESNLELLLLGIAEEFVRLEERGHNLVDEADPRTTNEMLADWEAMVGLPDACHGLGATLEKRRAELVARLTSQGSLSRAFYTHIAEMLGFTVLSIDEFTPSAPGPGGLGYAGNDWWFVWRMNVADDGGVTYFTCDSLCDERLSEFGDQVLECLLNRLKPAHTRLLVAFIDTRTVPAPLLARHRMPIVGRTPLGSLRPIRPRK